MAHRGYKELVGAHGKITPVREAVAEFYRSTGSVRVGQVVNTIGSVCPARLRELVEAALQDEITEIDPPLTGPAVCQLEVDVVYTQPPSKLGALLGKGAILLGRARLFNEQHVMQADLMVGVFSEALRTNDAEMAKEFAKTLVHHVTKRARRLQAGG